LKYILDTHIWIWAANSDSALPAKYRKLLGAVEAGEAGLVDISIWEAGRVHRAGALTSGDPITWFERALSQIFLLPISPAISLVEQSLTWEHRDPADRLIVAAALVHSTPLMTCDKEIIKWGGVRIV
jgi:PIN domain nuclease of toxin-antitoxin system